MAAWDMLPPPKGALEEMFCTQDTPPPLGSNPPPLSNAANSWNYRR